MKQHDEDRLLTRQQVKERFGIGVRFLEVAVSKKNGPRRVNLGRSVRYRVKDIRDWIESCSVEADDDGGIE